MDEVRGGETGGRRKFVKILIIAIVVVLLVIAGWVIYQAVKKTSEDIDDIASSSDLEILEAALIENETVQIIVQRNSKRGDLVGINFNISDGQNFTIIRVNTTMQKKDNETFIFSLDELRLTNFVSVSIAPIYLTAEGEEVIEIVGETTDTTTTISSGGGGGSSGGDGGTTPTCSDEIMNGDETGVDCGGSSCSACPTCSDGIMNQDEISVDCGGSCDDCFAGTVYYISMAGNDSTGDGSISNPWRSLYKACNNVTTFGDMIHVNAGTYTENTQCSLAVGVSIEGEGDTSIISSNISTAWTPTILLQSASEGTNGNQTISYIKMDGNGTTAWEAIQINARSNVEVHHSTFIDFFHSGVTFNAKVAVTGVNGAPTTYATGNKFYNNTMTNSADFLAGGSGYGELQFGGQDGIEIYNNYISSVDRATKRNGYNIKYFHDGYSKGFKIYNNELIMSTDGPADPFYDFSIELWHTQGGAEIYNNTMTGGIDFGGGTTMICLIKGDYEYGAWVHDNIIGPDTMVSGRTGIYLERNTEYAIIERNYFKNLYNGVTLTPGAGETTQNHKISYNIFNGIGFYGIRYQYGTSPGADAYNLSVYNNVFYVGSGGGIVGIGIPTLGGATSYINITNNIVVGASYSAILGHGTGTLDHLNIQNNIFYQNAYSNVPRFETIVPTNYINSDNIIDNPDFVTPGSDFTLQSSSLAINNGTNVGLTTDYDGNPIVGLPDIGAYEYQG